MGNNFTVPEGKLRIECRLYNFRGGAPPHRGYHYSNSITVEIDSTLTTTELLKEVKAKIDPNNGRDLSYYLLVKPLIGEEKTSALPKNEPLANVFNDSSKKLRVDIPMARGMVDVGTFGMMTTSPGADILLGKSDNISTQEISHLLSHFENATADGGRLQEFPEILNQEECDKICDYIERRFERAGVNAGEDFKITLQPNQMTELVSEEKGNNLFMLFDETCHEIILRRSISGGNFINFHTDKTLQTLNIPLNDSKSYKGGQLVYVKEDGLFYPERKTGSATLHTNKVLHGVTPVSDGVRYAMFLLYHGE
eukprot:CAMPEP_0201509504 /NCGR_PEP_ID=MMETSP0161_2-20130828/2539_1 /ASSEMBLY_ACC=CAM_ASM_000251 /TAXON_ID=180227 /ORGANISM="Neoparamoeba aestuarina, Strain SoJaBio B1-5/56/2" /LENGTH=309 /DNA_ID=CAMNT_0047904473 /DNA_START=177 /DNA_END=1106 /DNA_ORIENTATION=-